VLGEAECSYRSYRTQWDPDNLRTLEPRQIVGRFLGIRKFSKEDFLQLATDIKNGHERVPQLQQELERMKAHVATLQQQWQEQEGRLSQSTEENKSLMRANTSLEARLNDVLQLQKITAVQRQAQSKQLTAQKAIEENLRQEIQETISRLDRTTQQHKDEITQQAVKVHEQLRIKEEVLDHTHHEHNLRVTELDGKIAQLKADIQTVTAQKEKLSRQAVLSKGELVEARERLQQTREKLHAKEEALEKDIVQLKRDIHTVTAQKEEFSRQAVLSKGELAEALENLRRAHGGQEELGRTQKEYRLKITALKKAMDAGTAERTRLSNFSTVQKAIIETLQTKNDELSQGNEILKDRTNILQTQLSKMTSGDPEETQRQILQWAIEKPELLGRIKALQRQQKEIETSLEIEKSKRHEKKEHVKRVEAGLSELLREREKSNSENKSLRQENAALRRDATENEENLQRISALRSKLNEANKTNKSLRVQETIRSVGMVVNAAR